GELIDAPTAQAWGLVNRVVPASQLEDAVCELVATICRASGEVVALGKRAFYAQDQLPEGQAYDIACPVMIDNALIDDAHEGMHAFLEKRAPRWRTSSR